MYQILDEVGPTIIRFLPDSDLETLQSVSQKFKDISESALL